MVLGASRSLPSAFAAEKAVKSWESHGSQGLNSNFSNRLRQLFLTLKEADSARPPFVCRAEKLSLRPGLRKQELSEARGLGTRVCKSGDSASSFSAGRSWKMAALLTSEVGSQQTSRPLRHSGSSEAPLLPTHLVVSFFLSASVLVLIVTHHDFDDGCVHQTACSM